MVPLPPDGPDYSREGRHAARLPSRTRPPKMSLSPREREAVEIIIRPDFESGAVAARQMGISVRTFKNHIGHAATKLGIVTGGNTNRYARRRLILALCDIVLKPDALDTVLARAGAGDGYGYRLRTLFDLCEVTPKLEERLPR